MSAPDISTRDGLFAVMRQLAKEREEAKPRVAELMSRKELPWDEEIPEEWRTAGFAYELAKSAGATPENDPPKGAALLQFALATAVAAMSNEHPTVLVTSVFAETLIQLGWIEMYEDEYPSAKKSFDSASKHLNAEAALGFDRARVQQNLGAVYAMMAEYDKAFKSLTEASKLFREFGDTSRAASVDLLIAYTYQCAGDLRRAGRTIEDLFERIPSGDAHTLGTAYNNLAIIHCGLGNVDAAFDYSERARQVYKSIGVPSDKPDLTHARALLVAGKTSDALVRLRELRSRFLQRGISELAALIGLDIIDALLTIGSDSEALELAHLIIEELEVQQINERIIAAIVYLRDLLSEGRDVHAEVRRVRTFFELARQNRGLKFVPLFKTQ